MALENSSDAVTPESKKDQQETSSKPNPLPEATLKINLPEPTATKTEEKRVLEKVPEKMPTRIIPVFKPKCRIPVAQLIKKSTSSDEESDGEKMFQDEDEDTFQVDKPSMSGNQTKQLNKLGYNFKDFVQIKSDETPDPAKLSRQMKNRAKKDRRKKEKMKKILASPSLFDDQLCKIVDKMGSMDMNKHSKTKHKHKKRRKEKNEPSKPRVLMEMRDVCKKLINIINEEPKKELNESMKVSLAIDEHKLSPVKFKDFSLGVKTKKKKKKCKKHHHKYKMMKIQELLSRQVGLREVLEKRLQNKDKDL